MLFLCSSSIWASIIRHARYGSTKNSNKTLQHNRYAGHRAANCSTSTTNSQGAGHEQQYTNARQEVGRLRRCYTNSSSNLNLKSNNTGKSMVNNNGIHYFLPDPYHDNEKRVSVEIIKQLQRDFEDVFSGV